MKARLLAIESSCDECSAAVVESHSSDVKVLSVVTHTQIEIHRPYGGVVPEIASRNHLETINNVIDRALKGARTQFSDLNAIAVTNRPGLIGALLVGVSAAKSLSYALELPLVPVHHLEGHAFSPFLDLTLKQQEEIQYPLLLAVVSGGHTHLYVIKDPPVLWSLDVLKRSRVGKSLDDAAGEAFDKTAKLLGFPYPGGEWIEKGAKGGDSKAFHFPRALLTKNNFDFSFSGLKTSVLNELQRLKTPEVIASRRADLCASIQEAIVEVLATKIESAVYQFRCRTVSVVGGVAANGLLRNRLSQFPTLFPKREYCTDNAAMIGGIGLIRFHQGHGLTADDRLNVNAIAYPEV